MDLGDKDLKDNFSLYIYSSCLLELSKSAHISCEIICIVGSSTHRGLFILINESYCKIKLLFLYAF